MGDIHEYYSVPIGNPTSKGGDLLERGGEECTHPK